MAAYCSHAVWLLYLLNLNLIDYDIWSIMHEKVNTTSYPDVASSKQTIHQGWVSQTEAYVDAEDCA
jgi:hypothetical protein